MRLAVAGVGIGVLMVALAGLAMKALSYGVSAADSVTLVAAPVSMLVTALAASAPEWIAARSKPMSALRPVTSRRPVQDGQRTLGNEILRRMDALGQAEPRPSIHDPYGPPRPGFFADAVLIIALGRMTRDSVIVP